MEGSSEYVIAARDKGGLTAYARVSRFHNVSMVMEYGYRSGAEDAMLVLFNHLGEHASGTRCVHLIRGDHLGAALLAQGEGATAPAGVLITHTAHDKNLEQRLTAAGAFISYHEDNNYMWRIIEPGKLGQRLGLTPAEAEDRAFELFKSDNSLFWTADRF